MDSRKHPARQELYLVCLVAGSGDSTLSGTSAAHLAMYVVHVHGDACRHTVNHASYGGAVRLTEGGEAKESSEGIQDELKVKN